MSARVMEHSSRIFTSRPQDTDELILQLKNNKSTNCTRTVVNYEKIS